MSDPAAMPRLMFVTSSLSHGGAERHAVALANRLAEREHECHFVYLKRDASLLEQLRLPGGASVRCLGARRYLDLRALRDFVAYLSRTRPAAVVAANGYALMYAWLALRLARVRAPLIVTFHSTRLLGAKERMQMLAYRPLFWTSSCAVFVSERQRRHWLRRGVLSRRNEVIHNGVDIQSFREAWGPAKRAALRRALGFEDTDYVIGISALLRPEKNHLQLVDAIARLRAAGFPAKALMIGDGEMRAAIEARALSLGVVGDVAITGLRRDVRPYVTACDVMALCSVTEAFSLAAIEAMALSRPLVHSDVGGAAEMIEPGRNGFLFPVGDTCALVDRLSLLADSDLRESMGREARQVVQARFSERAMVDRYEALLLELAGDRAGEATVRPDHARSVRITH